MAAIGLYMSGSLLNRGFTELSSRNVRYFGVVWTQIFASFPQLLNITWSSLACRDPNNAR